MIPPKPFLGYRPTVLFTLLDMLGRLLSLDNRSLSLEKLSPAY